MAKKDIEYLQLWKSGAPNNLAEYPATSHIRDNSNQVNSELEAMVLRDNEIGFLLCLCGEDIGFTMGSLEVETFQKNQRKVSLRYISLRYVPVRGVHAGESFEVKSDLDEANPDYEAEPLVDFIFLFQSCLVKKSDDFHFTGINLNAGGDPKCSPRIVLPSYYKLASKIGGDSVSGGSTKKFCKPVLVVNVAYRWQQQYSNIGIMRPKKNGYRRSTRY